MKGYVAALDILGFSRRVSEGAAGRDLFNDYSTRLRGSLTAKAAEGIQHVVFSDTIVAYTTSDTEQNLVYLTRACSKLFHEMLSIDLPVRGCIAHGDFIQHFDANGRIVAGNPILEAHHYEGQQDWVGIMYGPSVIRRNPELMKTGDYHELLGFRRSAAGDKLAAPSVWLKRTAIPFHGSTFSGFALLPTSQFVADTRTVDLSLASAIEKSEYLAATAPDAGSQLKHYRTRDFLVTCRADFWRVLHDRS